jgi:hypothetical protein
LVAIEIKPKGTAFTDEGGAQVLAGMFPKSFSIAQDVVVAANKGLERRGLFSTDRSRRKALAREIRRLNDALATEMYPPSKTTANFSGRILGFLDVFAQVFPNWQEVYLFLNDFVPSEFGPAYADHRPMTDPAEIIVASRSQLTPDSKYVLPCPNCTKLLKIPVQKRLSIYCRGCHATFVRTVQIA